MPYTNVPRHLWGKMDRCVEKVMARDGLDKQRAIAICHQSIVKEEPVASARDRRKARRAAARQAAQADPEVVKRFGEHNEKRWGENSDPAVLEQLAQPGRMSTAFRKALGARFGEDAVDAALEDAIEAVEAAKEDPPEDQDPDIDPDLDMEPDDDEEPIELAADDLEAEEGKAGHMMPAMMEDEEDEEEEEKPKRKKPKKKDVYSQPMMEHRPYGGATSWAMFDDWLEARDKSARVHEVTYAFDMLIENIMGDPGIEPEDKGQAIAFLSEGFRSRILSLKQDMNIIERVKAALGGARRNDLPDSAFAYIEPGGKKDDSGKTIPRSHRHYPMHDKAHVRNALSRAAAAIKKGGKTAQIARAALPKIRAAAKRMGIGKPAESKKGDTGISIFKGTDGGWRWFGWVSNKWRDRDFVHAPQHGGEILTSDAHKEFVAWVDEDIKSRGPELWIWHTPGTARKHRADWIDFADGFLVASGPLEEEEAGQLMALELLYDLGMSHGMNVLARDKANGYVTKYRSFEASPLPQTRAANPWTSFATIVKEVVAMGFTEEKRKLLAAALGEDATAALEGQTGEMAKMLTELGIDHKENPAPTEKPADAPKTAKAEEQPAPTADGVALAKAIVEEMNLNGLSEFLKRLDGEIKEIKAAQSKSAEQVLAEAIAPKASGDLGRIWDSRPSASRDNVVAKEGEAQPPSHSPEAEGEHGWVSQVMGIQQPVQPAAG